MAKQRRGYRIDMVNGPLAGKILFFALPLMASSLLQLLFNAADIVVVGALWARKLWRRWGPTALWSISW